jgi:hypothetical protein
VACWAHFRCKVFDLHKRMPTSLTTDILDCIGALCRRGRGAWSAAGCTPSSATGTKPATGPSPYAKCSTLPFAACCPRPTWPSHRLWHQTLAGCAASSAMGVWRSTTTSWSGPGAACRGKARLAVPRFGRRRLASRRHLHRHPDLQGQRRRPAGLNRRCRRQDRRRPARLPLGRGDAVELRAPDRSANSLSHIDCGPYATLTPEATNGHSRLVGSHDVRLAVKASWLVLRTRSTSHSNFAAQVNLQTGAHCAITVKLGPLPILQNPHPISYLAAQFGVKIDTLRRFAREAAQVCKASRGAGIALRVTGPRFTRRAFLPRRLKSVAMEMVWRDRGRFHGEPAQARE